MRNIYFLLSTFLVFLLHLGVYGQTSINMGSQPTISSCGFYIYDDGGINNNYSNNANQTLTIYSNDPNNGCVMVEIQSLDIDPSDTLIFYDGVGTAGTILHKINNSNYDPTGTFRYAATIQNTTGAVTVQFKSDGADNGGGFTLFSSCIAPCQRVLVNYDTLLSSHIPHIDPTDGYYYIDVCPYDTVHMVTYCTYPDNNFSYNQNDMTTTFKWDFGIDNLDSVGGQAIDYYFTPGRGYDVSISAVDSAHCASLIPVAFRVRTSKNPIRDIAHLNPICSGEALNFSVGYDNLSSVQLDSIGSEQIASLGVNDTVFLPDGLSCPPYGYYYRSYVNFTSFAPNATITSPNDILYVRIKMEHSAIEDIRITFVCPEGNESKIVPDYQNDGWGGITHYFRTNLGCANRLQEVTSCNAAQNPMGIAWNYVWSNNSTLGYQYANTTNSFCYEPGNVHQTPNPYWDDGSLSYKIDSTDVANMTQVYHPNQSFANMIGCHLNGGWYIQVQDLWTNDNGYILEWEMALDPHLLPQNWSYNVQVDTTYIVGPGANGMYMVPDTCGNLNYTAYVVDDYGCVFDTIIPVSVVSSPKPDLGQDFNICHGDIITLSSNYNQPNTTYHWNTGDDTPDISVITGGDYIVSIATANSDSTVVCHGSDTIHVGVYPAPHANFSVSDTTGCAPLNIRLTNETTPTIAGSNFEWLILNDAGNMVYSSHLANPSFEITDPGTYTVVLRVSTSDGCTDSLYKWQFLHVLHQPIAEFESDPEISLFAESQGLIHFVNYADSSAIILGDGSWHWDFGDGESDDATFSPTHNYTSWGDYNVTLSITSGEGCSSEITHKVVIEDNLIFPNIITPNGDNVNDIFAIQNLNTNINPEDPDEYRTNELYIYDRWGKRVYYAKNYDTYAKDGQPVIGNQFFDAAGLSDGVYYYSFYYKGKAKVVDYHGSLTVTR